jgi:hypothetical protein
MHYTDVHKTILHIFVDFIMQSNGIIYNTTEEYTYCDVLGRTP